MDKSVCANPARSALVVANRVGRPGQNGRLVRYLVATAPRSGRGCVNRPGDAKDPASSSAHAIWVRVRVPNGATGAPVPLLVIDLRQVA